MRVLALEYAAAGGILETPQLAPCRAEGEAMLRALLCDLAEIPGVGAFCVLDAEAEGNWPAASVVARVEAAPAARAAWAEAARGADACWVVAPETNGILADLTRMMSALGCPLLGSAREAVEVAASKLRTAELLARHGVPIVPTRPLDAAADLAAAPDGWVVKPDDGVGADGVRYHASFGDALCSRDTDDRRASVIQPFVPGTPISLSLLAKEGEAWLLACNVQDVRRRAGAFLYAGGWVGGAEELRPALAPIAAAIARALPGLFGYVGVDLVAAAEGPLVLEVNPRLTTSYVGLRRSIGVNVAELVLRLPGERLADLVRPLAPRRVRVDAGSETTAARQGPDRRPASRR